MIHPKAHVENADVHETASVWQFASVIRGAKVGRDCVIGAGAVIDGAVLGDRVHVQSNAVLGPGIVVGNDVFIGPSVSICNDAYPRTHQHGWDLDAVRANPVVIIEDGASICANAVICPGVRIGSNALVPAGEKVSADVKGHRARWWVPSRIRPVKEEAA